MNPLVGKIVVLEQPGRVPTDPLHAEVKAVCADVIAAERWIRQDTVDTFSGSDRSLQTGPVEDWGSDMIICQVLRVVRPIPHVKISASIGDVD